MGAKFKTFLIILLLTCIPVLLIWLPFFFRMETVWGIPLPRDGMATIVANYDGPLYIVVAKTMYMADYIRQFEFGLPIEYYAAHFPLYPLLIKPFAAVIGFPYALLLTTLISTLLALWFFKRYTENFINRENAWWLTAVFAVFPARWLIVRSVGSPEPLFIAAIIASIFYFKKERFLLSGVWGAIAAATKSPGILLFIALLAAYFFPSFKKVATLPSSKWLKSLSVWKTLPLLLIPLSLFSVFYFYSYVFNDFFAYFNSGDNIHLFFPPFQIFNYSEPWVGTFWLEEIIFVYLFGALGLLKLIQKGDIAASWFVGIFFATILFVSHRDIIRYSLPIVPFLLTAFANTLIQKEFKIVMAVIIIPIYLFSIVYISQNVMPISDWAPLL